MALRDVTTEGGRVTAREGKANGDMRQSLFTVLLFAVIGFAVVMAGAGQASVGRWKIWQARRRKPRQIGFRNGLSHRAERGTPCHGTTSSPGIATAKGVSDRRAQRRRQPLYSAMS